MNCKKNLILLICLILSFPEFVIGQSKRIVLLEHFTNTTCNDCKTKNDVFFSNILPDNLNEVIHISYFAPIPSSSSFFHSQNPTDNFDATNYYGITTTPKMVMNGTVLDDGSELIAQSDIDDFTSAKPESPIVYSNFNLSDDGNGNYDLRVIVGTEVAQPLGEYVIRTALVESEVAYNAPNGETLHKNIMRKMLNNFAGRAFFPPTVGNLTFYDYSFTADPSWNSENLYIISWIQDLNSKEVLNVASSKNFLAPLKSVITKYSPVSCFDGTDGGLEVDVSDGIPPYKYLWSNGDTTKNLTDAKAGVYFLVVTDAAGNITEEQGSVTEPEELQLKITKTDEENQSMNGSAILAISGGTPNIVSGVPIYEVEWSYPDGSEQTNVLNIENLTSGIYFVKVTDSKECSLSESFSIFRNIGDLQCEIIVSEPLCTGDNNGSMAVTCFNANPPLTYNWSDGGVTPERFNMAAGTYTVIVTDGIGAVYNKQVTLDNPPALQNFIETVNETNDMNDGSACHNVTGGTPPYDITWSVTESKERCLTDLSADNAAGSLIEYSCIVEDENGCDLKTDFTLLPISTDLNVVVIKKEDISCTGEKDGYIEVLVSGGEILLEYDIDWAEIINDVPSEIQTSPSNTTILRNLSAGTYQVTAKDDKDSIVMRTIEIVEPDEFSIEVTSSDICKDEAGNTVNGVASAKPSGGLPPYSYQWSNGNADSTIVVSQSSNYTISVFDSNLCEQRETVFIAETDMICMTFIDIFDQALTNNFSLLPTAANEQIYIALSDASIRQFNFKVVDITGRTVQTKLVDNYVPNSQINISVNQLSSGIYFGVIEVKEKIARQKFIKM